MSAPEDDPAIPDPVFALADVMRRAMQTSYGMIARDALKAMEIEASVVALIEVLLANGTIDRKQLEDHRREVLGRIDAERDQRWSGPSLAEAAVAAAPARRMDCESRHPHCNAACCVLFRVMLTPDEVRGGEILWDLAAPYQLPRTATGHCVNLDQVTLRCLIWETRPAICRTYACEDDNQVWQDFQQMIPTDRVRALSRSAREAAR